MIVSTRDASADGGKDSTLPQQPHSEDGRFAQQALAADADFVVVQAEATSANDSMPMIAPKATRRMFVLGRRVVMAYKR